MFGQTTRGADNLSDAGTRMYRIEVEGMGQNTNPDRLSYRIRSTGKTYLSVPYNRLSEQMQRILRMGGRVVSIAPLTLEGDSQAKKEATAVNQPAKVKQG
ncbi:MAG: CpcD phycobilisome linker protein [Chloroflexaceae bacterium]|nr:CpcD phycobilisome linker protein [Chloroflexaceae bacterium]